MAKKKKRKERGTLTPEQIEELIEMIIQGHAPKAVAHKYDVVAATVYFHMRTKLDHCYRRKEVQLELSLGGDDARRKVPE